MYCEKNGNVFLQQVHNHDIKKLYFPFILFLQSEIKHRSYALTCISPKPEKSLHFSLVLVSLHKSLSDSRGQCQHTKEL